MNSNPFRLSTLSRISSFNRYLEGSLIILYTRVNGYIKRLYSHQEKAMSLFHYRLTIRRFKFDESNFGLRFHFRGYVEIFMLEMIF